MKVNAFNLLVDEMRAEQDVLLVGGPGCAKTASILAAADVVGLKTQVETEEGIQSTVFRASLMERVDLTGCMVPDNKRGVTRQLPLSLIKGLQNAKEPTLAFFDDIGQGPIDTQASLMRLFDNHFFPSHVRIWAATNRPGDKSGVTSLCEPLRSRFDAAYIIPTPGMTDLAGKTDGGVPLCSWVDWAENWMNWAQDNNAGAEVIAWHKSTNFKSLYDWKPHVDPSVRMADFRSWASMIDRWNKGLRSLSQVSSVLGKAVATEFLAFVSLADELPTIEQIRIDPLGAKLPQEPSAQWLMICMLYQQIEDKWMEQFVQYVERMPRVMTAFACRSAYNKWGKKFAENKAWSKWFTKNSALYNL